MGKISIVAMIINGEEIFSDNDFDNLEGCGMGGFRGTVGGGDAFSDNYCIESPFRNGDGKGNGEGFGNSNTLVFENVCGSGGGGGGGSTLDREVLMWNLI